MAWVEKQFEERMVSDIDVLYQKTFSDIVSIDRSNRDSTDKKILFMDKELAIDTFITFGNGSQITLQEKTLKPFQQKYQHFTFEYYNDPTTKDEGEWFKLAAMLYFFGYGFCTVGLPDDCTKRCEKCECLYGYKEYWILDVALLKIFLKTKYTMEFMEKKWLRQNPPPAKANFFAIPFRLLPDDVFVVRKNINNIKMIDMLKGK